MDNMNGLDLDMSQSQALWKRKNQQPFGSPGVKKGLLERNDFMESLDLNIGFESIQKLQDDWFGGAKGKKKKEEKE